jgi:hypothetical protein
MKRQLTVRWAFAALAATALPAASAAAQAPRHRFTVDEQASIAWWQISPHLNHLWATTCPTEPNWQPGEDRGSGWQYDPKKAPRTGHAAVIDTTHVPLFPRLPGTAQPICPPAVRGEITATDINSWTGVSGVISINSAAFVTGLNMRDEYAKKAIFQSPAHPNIRFWVDSLTNVSRGDTITALAVGRFEFRGTKVPIAVRVRAWMEGGNLRVTGRYDMPPTDLIEKYRVSQLALGLGVGTGVWRILHLGLDVVLKDAGSGMSQR